MLSDNIKKIRRFIRDPNSNIWDDSFLINLWNDEQREFGRKINPDQAVTVLRHPAIFQIAYMYFWEWTHFDADLGNAFQALIYHYQWRGVCCFNWEAQGIGVNSASETTQGAQYTQPWEAYTSIDPYQMPPQWFPMDFQDAIFMAYDKDPLEFTPWKNLQGQDRTFEHYQGEPRQYTTKDEVSNQFYIYPRPSAVWDDFDGNGVMIDADWATSSAETGSGIDLTGAETTQNLGADLDALRMDDNILLIYRKKIDKISGLGDEPAIDSYLHKYLEYGVIAKAYAANTDGRIKSLADYWMMRKELGYQVLTKYFWKRLEDRNFQLTSQRVIERRHRGPRLPSTYPNV